MTPIEISQSNLNEFYENPTFFSQYMNAQIHEIESFVNSANSESDKNRLAISWIEEHADQFRANWHNTH